MRQCKPEKEVLESFRFQNESFCRFNQLENIALFVVTQFLSTKLISVAERFKVILVLVGCVFDGCFDAGLVNARRFSFTCPSFPAAAYFRRELLQLGRCVVDDVRSRPFSSYFSRGPPADERRADRDTAVGMLYRQSSSEGTWNGRIFPEDDVVFWSCIC